MNEVLTMPDQQAAYQLLDQLDPHQLSVVINLLKIMIHDDDHLTDNDVQAIAASREYFRKNPEGGVSFEQVIAECGFTMDQIDHSKKAIL